MRNIFVNIPFYSPRFFVYHESKIMLFSSSGIENNPTIFYQLIRGSTDQTNKYDTFYVQQRTENGWTYADVKVNFKFKLNFNN